MSYIWWIYINFNANNFRVFIPQINQSNAFIYNLWIYRFISFNFIEINPRETYLILNLRNFNLKEFTKDRNIINLTKFFESDDK